MRAHVARHLLIAAGRGDSSGSDDRHACYAGITRGLDQSPAPRLSSRNPGPGGVAERLKAAVLKTAGPKGLAGSNPASSAFVLWPPRPRAGLVPAGTVQGFFPESYIRIPSTRSAATVA